MEDLAGHPGGHIFKSENAGDSWTNISTTLPDAPFHCLLIDPNQTSNLYAGCDLTVYVSSNDGNDWFTYADGLPDAAMIFDLVYSPFDNKILAFTHGNGVYKNDMLEDAVGIQEPLTIASAVVFPNPVSDVLTIVFNSAIAEVNAQLLDASGEVVKERNFFSAEKFNWNLSGVASGTYLIHLQSQNFSSTQKVAVIH